MLSILTSKATEPNQAFTEKPRDEGADNLRWIEAIEPQEGTIEVLLLGGRGPVDFRLRIAQAHARHDLSPSHWSHVLLVAPRAAALESTPIFEVSLTPPTGFGFPVPVNAVQTAELGRYGDPKAYPNLALIQVRGTWEVIERHVDRLRRQRAAVDLTELLLTWLAFAWGAGKMGNPLLDGRGIPSAVMVELVLGAAGVNLTPGSVQGASCPEMVWQAAKWWQEFYSGSGDVPL